MELRLLISQIDDLSQDEDHENYHDELLQLEIESVVLRKSTGDKESKLVGYIDDKGVSLEDHVICNGDPFKCIKPLIVQRSYTRTILPGADRIAELPTIGLIHCLVLNLYPTISLGASSRLFTRKLGEHFCPEITQPPLT
ncbi:hypothetical protein E2542_SST08125 [Spatholobus suberectus]|nr:hypothetical protein E2542_SST08125 [Spatholobus suberectus]